MTKEKKYLEFIEIPPSKISNYPRKTKLFEIWNEVQEEKIGKIYWDGGWRQYVSELDIDAPIRFTKGCHREIADFIERLMDERRSENNGKM